MTPFIFTQETTATADERFMLRAAELAERGRGKTAPNPTVGAILVKSGQVVAEGWHQRYGGPHAEVECLADAAAKGVNPADCELYVTLEPCNHHGKTPPCTEAILRAGVKRVVVGRRDPNLDVKGGGADFLRASGVRVDMGVAEDVCDDLIADFKVWVSTRLPYAVCKLATTLDGKIASRGGHGEIVSGQESRSLVHGLRARMDAILVGGATFVADNPRLTPRFSSDPWAPRKDPLAVVVTTRLPAASADFHLLQKRPGRTIFWTTQQAAESDGAQSLMDIGCQVWGLSRRKKARGEETAGLDLADGLRRLRRDLNCHHVLCEGGGGLAWSLMASELAHEAWTFHAPLILGDNSAPSSYSGRTAASTAPATHSTPPTPMKRALRLRLSHVRLVGQDVLTIHRPLPASD